VIHNPFLLSSFQSSRSVECCVLIQSINPRVLKRLRIFRGRYLIPKTQGTFGIEKNTFAEKEEGISQHSNNKYGGPGQEEQPQGAGRRVHKQALPGLALGSCRRLYQQPPGRGAADACIHHLPLLAQPGRSRPLDELECLFNFCSPPPPLPFPLKMSRYI